MKEEKSSARKARKKGRKKEGEGGLGPPMKNRSRSQVLREEMESSMSRPVGRLAQAPAPPRSFPPSRRAAASVDISDDSFDSCDDRDSGGKWDSYMDKVEKRSYGIEVTSSPSKRKQPVGQQGFGNGNSSSGSESDGSFTHGPSAAPTRTTAAEREHHKAMKEKIRRTILTKKIAAKTKVSQHTHDIERPSDEMKRFEPRILRDEGAARSQMARSGTSGGGESIEPVVVCDKLVKSLARFLGRISAAFVRTAAPPPHMFVRCVWLTHAPPAGAQRGEGEGRDGWEQGEGAG